MAAVAGTGSAAGARPAGSAPPVVVAVMGEPGSVNVLHQEFRTADGRDPAYPPGMPRPQQVSLPAGGSFDDQLAALKAGPLAHLRPGVLYAVRGTRLVLLNVGSTSYDAVGGNAVHATGVVDAVVGNTVGTAPHALAVVVLGGGNDTAYRWLANQGWVDLATTSDYTVSTTSNPSQCIGSAPVRAFSRSGRILFSSSGNTTDQPEALISPNGLPDTYLVGGVDSTGATWRPGHPEESDPFYVGGNVVRPYETGERFSFQAAAPDSLSALVHFGGTSGATPLTAGWAARLIQHARDVVGATAGTSGGALATGPRHSRRGPLGDGRLSRDELVALMHAVAEQRSGLPGGVAYAAEGYGALNVAAIGRAEQILNGRQILPTRAADDSADAATRQLRQAVFSRCPSSR
jgi:hypothetical protein